MPAIEDEPLDPDEWIESVKLKAAQLGEAIDTFRNLDHEMWAEIGQMFTCDEADALVALLEGNFLHDHAESLLLAHAAGDREEEGDRHCEIGQLARDIDEVTAMIGPG